MKTYAALLCVFMLCFSLLRAQQGGYALQFDGTDDYVDVPDITIGGDITVSAWVWVSQYGLSWPKIMEFASPGANRTNNITFGFSCPPAKLFYETSNNGAVNGILFDDSIFPLNTWVHVAAVHSGSNVYLYKNGVLVKSSVFAAPVNTTRQDNYIGKSHWAENTPFCGLIDEFQLWSTARTQAQIISGMYKEASADCNLKIYYKMSNGSGASVTDNSGNGYTGTLVSGPVWKASGCFSGPGKCMQFDGTDDYVNLNSIVMNTYQASFTIEAWIKTTVKDEGIAVFQNDNTTWDYGEKCFYIDYSGYPCFVGWGCDYIKSNQNVADGVWHHVAVTWAYSGGSPAGAGKIYVDGVDRTTYCDFNACTPEISGMTWRLGKFNNGESHYYFSGYMDEVRFWNVARTASQIRENMMCPLTGSETGLRAYYRFDQSEGSTLYDMTSNAYNGTLINMPAPACWVSSSAYNTWLGSVDCAWCTASNWSRNSCPVSTDNAGIYKWNSLSNEVTLSGTPSVKSFLVSSSAAPVISSGFTVNGVLALENNLNLNEQILTLGSTGSLSEGSFRIYGSTGSINTTQTLSNISSYNLGGMGAVITSAANLGSTVITRGHSQQLSPGGKSILRYYDISPANNTSLNATLVFNYNHNELNGISESNLCLFRSTNLGETWDQKNGTVDTVNNTVTLSGISSFSRWTLGDKNSPLPVTLKSFSSSVNGRDVRLTWSTSSETNNAGFATERKTAESEWTKIGFVKGNGTVSVPSNYSYEDRKLSSGKYQYRLKQVDFNGNSEYFPLDGFAEVEAPAGFDLSRNYPNPFNPSTKIDFQIPVDSKVSLVIYDIIGREVKTLINNEFRKADYYTVEFNAAGISSGVYFYRMRAGDFREARKMIVLK